jgi:putative Ca2+/H+ antiporter (TMEM165/GDT1 family)
LDALMAALVAAALAGIGDRPAHLSAILADRSRPGVAILAALVALAAATALAAIAGTLLAPMLTPEAARLLLALALALQGCGALWPGKPPERLDRWRLGGFATATLGLFILAFGDGVQFVVAALTAGGGSPILAAAGATIGATATITAAALLGERGWLRLPLNPVRWTIAALFLVLAAILALQALHLV